MNLVPFEMRMELIVLAGDKLRQANAGVTASGLNDSLELQEDELGPDGDAGSNFKDFLKYISFCLMDN